MIEKRGKEIIERNEEIITNYIFLSEKRKVVNKLQLEESNTEVMGGGQIKER